MFSVAWGSCRAGQLVAQLYTLKKYSPKAYFALGDLIYSASSMTAFGHTTTQADGSSTVADFTAHYEQARDNPGQIYLRSLVNEFYLIEDDHMVAGDNWDSTIAQANDGAGGMGLTDDLTGQNTANTHFARAHEAVTTFVDSYCDNQANTDADAIAELPAGASNNGASPSVSDYAPVPYFRVGYDINGNIDNDNPHIEFFCIHCIAYRSPIGGDVTMLGANQLAWLKAHTLASTAKFKAIVTPKKMFKNAGADNGDTFGEYTTERDDILDHFKDNSITGVFFMAGDRHTPSVEYQQQSDGDTYDALCVNACPLSQSINATADNMTLTDETKQYRKNRCYGVVEVETDKVTISMCRVDTGAKFWSGQIKEGTNAVSYPSAFTGE